MSSCASPALSAVPIGSGSASGPAPTHSFPPTGPTLSRPLPTATSSLPHTPTAAPTTSAPTTARRSHRGCTRCRSHKIRCDEARPRCGSCIARGHSDCCFGLRLKWEADYVGRAFGRAGVWSKTGKAKAKMPLARLAEKDERWLLKVPRVYSYAFLNLSAAHLCDAPIADTRRSTRLDHALLALDIARPPALFGTAVSYDTHLLSYYLDRICPLTIPYRNSTSPFSALLLPLATSASSSTMLEAMLGIAAAHRARFEPDYATIALTYATRVTRALRLLLREKSAADIAADPEPLVLTMLLCQLEVTRDSGSQWVVHLRGARDLIRCRRPLAALPPSVTSASASAPSTSPISTSAATSSAAQIIRFVERYFAFYDVMGRTACGEEPIFGADFWSSQEDDLDDWMGCSPRLVSIVSDITELSWKYHRRHAMTDDDRVALHNHRERLYAALQRPLAENDDLDDIARAGIELKRLTVQLYLYSALDDTTPTMPAIREGVQQILRLVFVLLQAGVRAGLTWPLFMAACQLDPAEDLEWATADLCSDGIPHGARLFILFAIDQLQDSLSNVARTREVIERIWSRRELALSSEQTYTQGTRCFNDWARYVAPFSHNISLV